MIPLHEELLQEFQNFAKTAASAQSVMEHIARRLHEEMARFNWVGFYLVDPADPRIPLDRGLCGAAARSGQVVVVHDVSTDPRYLAGSTMVKCEIVVPIFAKSKLAAELDIESYFTHTFNEAEQEFVEGCAAVVGNYLEKA